MIDPAKINQALMAIEQASDLNSLEQLRVKYLGRKGVVTEALRQIGRLPVTERSQAGAKANRARVQLEAAIKTAEQKLAKDRLAAETRSTVVDPTAPTAVKVGHQHPVTQVLDELVRIFWQMGYEVADGPEIETEWYNFEALNIAADHPARDMQDTFYLEKANLPRTHTSSVQIRFMEQSKPPIRIIAPGKVYRNEDEDASHIWSFQQLEGLVVDKDVSVADLKGTLLVMLQGILGEGTRVRLRPNFFPYTEPSIEFDASCAICQGNPPAGGCNTCKGTGWLELGGSGMVHPQVLRNVGIDPEVYSGFAFGFGIERLAAVKFGTPDLREFWRPNLKFLEQF